MSIYTQVCQMSKEVRNVFWGEYPSFVFGSNLREVDFIPIFVYHRIDPVEFESDLSFLQTNGYRTVTGEEYIRWMSGERGLWKRCVFLTFDDGMSSVYLHGLPLLKKYSMHAMVFLVAGYIPEKVEDDEPDCRDNLWNPLLSWDEIRHMQASGCFSFGSHTCYHHPVFISDNIIDFVNPESDAMLFDIPVEKTTEKEILKKGETMLWGAPIYRHNHFMKVKCLYGNEGAANACMEHVQEKGGALFFRRLSWKRELKEVAARYGSWGRMMGPREVSELIAADLRASKAVIEQRLGNEISQLCYPAGAGSALSVMLSKEAGYRTNLWQTLPSNNKNQPGCDPFRLGRLEQDFLRRLPGRG